MLISVLVPVYNVSSYIYQCIESVLKQTYKDWELILVDDGSTDECPQICDFYAQNDNRIKVVHKNNGGLASARNEGLKNASGEWVMMLDGDDWLCEDALEKCIEEIYEKGVDYIKFGAYYQYDNFTKTVLYPSYSQKLQFLQDLIARRVPLSIWGGLYKKELFDKLNPTFTEGLNFGEDYSVTPRLLYVSKYFSIINQPLYNYRIQNNGYVGSARWENVSQLIACEKIIFDYFEDKDDRLYIQSLLKGRANIKAYCYSMILKDYKNNKKYYSSIKALYHNSIDLQGSTIDAKLLYFIMKNRCTMTLFRYLWNLRIYVANVYKTLYFKLCR